MHLLDVISIECMNLYNILVPDKSQRPLVKHVQSIDGAKGKTSRGTVTTQWRALRVF